MISNKNRKLIVIDLDGTLLETNAKKISEYNLKVINELKRRGHIVCICTGRPWRAAKKIYYNMLKLETLIGTYNGGLIFSPFDKEYGMKTHSLNKEIINQALNSALLNKNILNLIIEFENDVYKLNNKGKLLDHISSLEEMVVKPIKKDKNGKLKIYSNPFSLLIDVQNINDSNKLFDDLINTIGDRVFIRFWSVEVDGTFVIELNPRHSNKGIFLKEACKYYQINPKNVITFGDGDNDIEILKLSNEGVAMKNSKERVKSISNKVTEFDNDNSGVGRYLNKRFKLKIDE